MIVLGREHCARTLCGEGKGGTSPAEKEKDSEALVLRMPGFCALMPQSGLSDCAPPLSMPEDTLRRRKTLMSGWDLKTLRAEICRLAGRFQV